MRDLLSRSGLTTDKVNRLSICAKLQEYRSTLASPNAADSSAIRGSHILSVGSLANLHRFETIDQNISSLPLAEDRSAESNHNSILQSSSTATSAITPGKPLHSRVPFAAANDDAIDPSSPIAYHHDDDGGVGDYWSPVYNVDEPVLRSPVNAASSSAGLGMPNMKLRWSIDGTSDQGKENQRALQQSLEVLTAANEYAYFDLEAITTGGNNAWAGSQHWKYATRSRTQPQDSGNNAGDVEATNTTSSPKKATKKKASKKEVQTLSFSLDLMDEKKFTSSKGRTDTTVMTKAAQTKAEEESSSLLLPVDEKFQVKDLCRLSLWSNVVVAPKNVNPNSLSSAITHSAGTSKNRAQILVDYMTGGETFWSQNGTAAMGTSNSSNMVPIDIQYGTSHNEGHDDGYDFDDAGGDYYGGDDMAAASSNFESFEAPPTAPPLSGLDINVNNLVQADRTVEKINIK